MASAVLSMLCLLGTVSVSRGESKQWYFTTVDQKWLDAASLTALESSPDISFTQLAMRTSAVTDTRLVCMGPEYGTVQADLIVVPHNEESGPGPRVPCLTNRDPTNILTAQSGITVHASTPPVTSRPARNASNLLDGVYDGMVNTCYHTSTVVNPYVVLNLGATRAVKNVLLISHPKENVSTFQNVDVRVGTYPTLENFSGYTRLGFMEGTVTVASCVFKTNSPNPVVGQYLSVQAYMHKAFQVCHMEIYA